MNRQNMLERLKLRAPPLSPALEVLWPSIRNNYCRQVALRHNKHVGCYLVQEVNRVISELGKHFGHPDPAVLVSKKVGDPKAFENFVNDTRLKWLELKDTNETPAM